MIYFTIVTRPNRFGVPVVSIQDHHSIYFILVALVDEGC